MSMIKEKRSLAFSKGHLCICNINPEAYNSAGVVMSGKDSLFPEVSSEGVIFKVIYYSDD